MKITSSQILSALSIGFGLLSFFSIWNIYNWDLLGWGTKLFLFPFLAVISFLGKLSIQQNAIYLRLQVAMLLLHFGVFVFVFDIQDPHSPNLLLLLLPLLLATTILIFSKTQQLINKSAPQQLIVQKRRLTILLLVAAVCYISMALFRLQEFLMPGIILETLALVFYFFILLRNPNTSH
jgi:hypothetical protein